MLPIHTHSMCRFVPTCSEYMKQAIQTYGVIYGVFLGIKRIFRCHPFGKFGYDPVPLKKKKWYNGSGDVMLNKIINIFIFFIVGVTFVFFFLFQKNTLFIFFLFSAFCLLLGICYALKKNKLGYLSFGVGISGFATYYVYVKKLLDVYSCITFMISLSVSITLFFTLLFYLLSNYYYKKEYSILVEGEVVDLIRKKDSKKEFYKPVYSYSVDNLVYTVEYIKFINLFIPNIGDKKKLYVHPKDHLNVYFMPEKFETIVNLFTCLTFIIFPIFIIIGLFWILFLLYKMN